MIFYLYALALLFLPFDFFTFYEQNIFGTTWTLSKILQISTYIIILVKMILDKDMLIFQEIIASYKFHKYFIPIPKIMTKNKLEKAVFLPLVYLNSQTIVSIILRCLKL